jgi:hypothetical protein
MATMTLRFAFEKETKGAVRFQEVGEDGKPAFAPSIGTQTNDARESVTILPFQTLASDDRKLIWSGFLRTISTAINVAVVTFSPAYPLSAKTR